jgi:phosphoglycolate phosphatase-like HAD superfamily hydrolase
MERSEQKPEVLTLDFDGVICNGLKEYFQISVLAYRQLWPNLDPQQPLEWELLFGRLRPVVETGWEMPLVLKAIQEGQEEANILLNWPQIRAEMLARLQITPKQLGAQVDGLRDQWINQDLAGWLGLHEFYAGVPAQLRNWIEKKLQLFIITTKESRFVDALLRQQGITLPGSAIFGKDCRQPKSETLRRLQAQGHTNIWFVEDRFETLKAMSLQADLQSVALFLGDWGYNTQRERDEANIHPSITLITLKQFAQPFENWG